MENTVNEVGKADWKRHFLEKIMQGLFPRNCVVCEKDREGGGHYLCPCCQGRVRLIQRPYCYSCGVPAKLDYLYPHQTFECGLCRKDDYKFDRARSLGWYDGVLKTLIHHLKYRNQPGVMEEITPYLKSHFHEQEGIYNGFSVVYLPLHIRKLKERGFDQAYLIARKAAEVLQQPLLEGAMVRVKDNPPQARLDRALRKANVKNAFAVARHDLIAGQDVLVVDDVFTTGSTVDEAAKVLKKAGASRVHVFTLARAPLGRQ